MKTKTFILKNELGFPSRSAVAIVHLARNSKSEVWIVKGAEKKNGKSIVDVLSLRMPVVQSSLSQWRAKMSI